MTLEEMLKTNGVETIEEYNAKIAAEAKEAAVNEQRAAEEALRKQIRDLEEIKAKQGGAIGDSRKEIDALRGKLLELEKKNMEPGKQFEKKPDDAPPSGKTEEQWRQENDAREKALTDDEWNKLESEAGRLPEDVRKTVLSTEEGRAAFMDEVLGSKKMQETFRRPVPEKKLSVQEQIQLALGKRKPGVIPSQRLSGSGFSSERKPIEPTKRLHPALLKTGSLRDMVQAHKELQKG